MGKLNVKMQGIDETEKQIQQEKKQQPAYEAEKKVGEFTDRISEVQNHSRALKGAAVKKNVQSDVKDRAASNIRVKKQVFSFRAAIKEINIWKAYVLSCGRSMESVGSEAMNEYIKKHKLSEIEQVVFNALMAKNVDMLKERGKNKGE